MIDEYQCEWKPTERDLKMDALAQRYHAEAEAFDRTVCTGPIRDGSILPANPREMAAISRNAIVRTIYAPTFHAPTPMNMAGLKEMADRTADWQSRLALARKERAA